MERGERCKEAGPAGCLQPSFPSFMALLAWGVAVAGPGAGHQPLETNESGSGTGRVWVGRSCPGSGVLQGALAPLLHLPQLGSVFPESRDSGVWAPRTSHQLSGAHRRHWAPPGGEAGAGGDEGAFVSFCLCQDGNRLPPAKAASSRCKGRAAPAGAGLRSAFGGWGTSMSLHFAPPSIPLLPPSMLSHQTWVAEPWLNIC